MLSEVSVQSHRFRLCARVQHAVVLIPLDHRAGQPFRELKHREIKVSTVLFSCQAAENTSKYIHLFELTIFEYFYLSGN